MLVISEGLARELVSMQDALAAVEEAFRAEAKGEAVSFPVVREPLAAQQATFGVKSGHERASRALGLKAGGYWRDNLARGLTNHQSFTLLFDEATGVAEALVSANYLTGLRTAAAAGVATRYLAREDAQSLGLIGAGGQALFQIRAIAAVRPIRRLLIAARTPARAEAVARAAQELGIETVEVVDAETAVREADIVNTLTPSNAPVLQADWLRPGLHVNAMGSDTKGKSEIPLEALLAHRLYVDDWAQSAAIGECQEAAAGRLGEGDIAGTLGGLCAGSAPARAGPQEITIFDSTGLAIQDLAVARLACEKARSGGLGIEVALSA